MRTVLLGPPGTVRDLVGALLAIDGYQVEAPGPGFAGEGADGGVAVVVTPGPGEWDALRHAMRGVVLVAERAMTDDEVLDAVLRGVDAVVTTDTSPLELGRAVEAVARGETLLGPAQARRLAAAARSGRGREASPRLTGREAAILGSIERGESVKQTARGLGIATKTVENLQSRLFRKLGAHNRAHAVTLARRLGLLDRSVAEWPVAEWPVAEWAEGSAR